MVAEVCDGGRKGGGGDVEVMPVLSIFYFV